MFITMERLVSDKNEIAASAEYGLLAMTEGGGEDWELSDGDVDNGCRTSKRPIMIKNKKSQQKCQL